MEGFFSLFGSSEQTRNRWLPYALLLCITLGLYSASLHFNFVWDDFYYVNRNFRIQSFAWRYFSSIWTNTYLGHYAPVHITFLAVLYRFSGLRPFGYHLAQTLLNGSCVLLVYWTVKKMESPRIALVATLLFAVHATNIETVAWISETKSTLAFLFFLLSFWSYIRLRERERWTYGALAGVFLILSILSKITTVVAPAIFLLYDYRQGTPLRKLGWKSLGSCFLISAVFAVVHVSSFVGSPQALESSYGGGLLAHWQNLPFLIWFYVRMSLFPYPVTAVEAIHIYNRFDWAVLLAWIALGAAVWLVSQANRDIQFWVLWFLILLATVLQIVPNTIWVADRYLYGPLVGVTVLVSKGFFRVADQLRSDGRRLAWEALMAGAIIALGWQTVNHLPIWKSDLSLWEGTAKTCPEVAYCHGALGAALIASGQPQRGGEELVLAAQLEPSVENLMNLGDALTVNARNFQEAVRIYKLALKEAENPSHRADRTFVVALEAKLARAYVGMGDFENAALALQAGEALEPGAANLRVVRAFLLWRQGKPAEARDILTSVLSTVGPVVKSDDFLAIYWGNRDEVREILSDLRSLRPPA